MISIKLFRRSQRMYFVKKAILWYISPLDSHLRILIQYVPAHIFHLLLPNLTPLCLPHQPKIVQFCQGCPLEFAHACLKQLLEVWQVDWV